MNYNISIHDVKVIKKLDTLGRKKGEYIKNLVLNDIKYEELENRVKELENKKEGE